MYKHPGVYVEHVPSGLLAIEAASTAIAAFIGPVKRGDLVTADKEDGKPVFISSQAQYATQFGTLDGAAGGLRNLGSAPDAFGWAVQSYFMNGGSKAYIVPIGDGAGTAASTVLGDPSDSALGLGFTAASEGDWANGMAIRMSLAVPDANPLETTYDIAIGLLNDRGVDGPVHLRLQLDVVARVVDAEQLELDVELDRAVKGPDRKWLIEHVEADDLGELRRRVPVAGEQVRRVLARTTEPTGIPTVSASREFAFHVCTSARATRSNAW